MRASTTLQPGEPEGRRARLYLSRTLLLRVVGAGALKALNVVKVHQHPVRPQDARSGAVDPARVVGAQRVCRKAAIRCSESLVECG